jgi:hypothetical protein
MTRASAPGLQEPMRRRGLKGTQTRRTVQPRRSTRQTDGMALFCGRFPASLEAGRDGPQ